MRRAEFVASIGGCLLVMMSLVIIWSARLSVPGGVYVSELGAEGMHTAAWFEFALLLLVLGGSAIAWAGRRERSRVGVLRAWSPAMSLWIGCDLFLIASQVTCTYGCPIPFGSTFNFQDFTHTLVAVLAFAAACWAMLQSAFAHNHRALAVFSSVAGILVAVIAATGGIFSLFRFQLEVGSWLEFVATTLAITWLVVFGAVLAARLLREAGSRSALHEPQQAISESH
ncbi:MAG: hypothetical protein ACOH10_02415 [Rhodoglobus sp.]